MKIRESIATGSSGSRQRPLREQAQDSDASANNSAGTTPVGIVVSDNSPEIGVVLSEFFVHRYAHDHMKPFAFHSMQWSCSP
jgi:hypothetical protein